MSHNYQIYQFAACLYVSIFLLMIWKEAALFRSRFAIQIQFCYTNDSFNAFEFM